jgi:hypothetical protein
MQCARPTFLQQHSAMSAGETFYKQDPAFLENKTAEMVCCLSEVRKEEGNCIGVTQVTLYSVWNVFKFIVLHSNFKCSGVHIPIMCTSLNIMSE